MKNNKSLRGGNDMESNYNIPFIIFIILLIILVIGIIYILRVPTYSSINTTPIPTYSSPFPTPTKEPNKKIFIDLDNFKQSLENWGDDINKLPKEIKEAVIKCYDNPEGCIF